LETSEKKCEIQRRRRRGVAWRERVKEKAREVGRPR